MFLPGVTCKDYYESYQGLNKYHPFAKQITEHRPMKRNDLPGSPASPIVAQLDLVSYRSEAYGAGMAPSVFQ